MAVEVQEIILPRLTSVAWGVRRDELLRFAALSAGRAPGGEPVDGYQRALHLGWSDDTAQMTAGWRQLDALGAHAPARLVLRRLREAGVTRLPRSTATAARGPNPLGLTDRQADVLQLLVSGRDQRRDRRAAAAVGAHRRPSRGGHPDPARGAVAAPGGGGGAPRVHRRLTHRYPVGSGTSRSAKANQT